MTEEELRRELRYILEDIAEQGYEQRFGYNNVENRLDEILDLIKEAGYRQIPEGYGLLKLEWPEEKEQP